jgi:hypothetical protein
MAVVKGEEDLGKVGPHGVFRYVFAGKGSSMHSRKVGRIAYFCRRICLIAPDKSPPPQN